MTKQTGLTTGAPAPGAVLPDVRRLWWVRLSLAILTVALGVAALAWPHATVRVVGLLFGLSLLLSGLMRAGVGLLAGGHPLLHRLFSAVIGVFMVVIGVVCVRNVLRSAVLLVLVIGIGWLLDGVTEILLGVAGAGRWRRWRIGTGVAYLLAAIAVIAWPTPILTTFVAVGALVLIALGLVNAAGAVLTGRALRTASRRTLRAA